MIWGTYGSIDDRWRIPCVPVTSFVLRHSWVTRSVETGRMPTAMPWTWTAIELPLALRIFVRGAVHGPKRTPTKSSHSRSHL